MSVTAAPSLMGELDAVIERGSAAMRAEKLRQITALFVEMAPVLADDHIAVFGDVFGRLIDNTGVAAHAELSSQLAPVKNAPLAIIRRLASADDIAIAGPVLAQSPQLAEADLLDLAQSMGQSHLLAISCRADLDKTITDVLVRRGDCDVIRELVCNPDARLSKNGYCALVQRAQNDGLLAQAIARRPDIVGYLHEIGDALGEMTDELDARSVPGDAALTHEADALQESDKVIDPPPASESYEETVATLAEISAVPLEVVEKVMAAECPDPVLILCKAAGLDWPTTRELILARPAATGITAWVLESACINFDQLAVANAQRVVRFWQAGQECPA